MFSFSSNISICSMLIYDVCHRTGKLHISLAAWWEIYFRVEWPFFLCNCTIVCKLITQVWPTQCTFLWFEGDRVMAKIPRLFGLSKEKWNYTAGINDRLLLGVRSRNDILFLFFSSFTNGWWGEGVYSICLFLVLSNCGRCTAWNMVSRRGNWPT